VGIIGNSRPGFGISSDASEKLITIAEGLSRIGDSAFLTGACHGFPMIIVNLLTQSSKQVIGFSPGASMEEHLNVFDSPANGVTVFNFTGAGIIGRAWHLVRDSDVVIAVDGNIGTTIEALIAVKLKRPLIIINDIGSFAQFLKYVLNDRETYPEPDVKYMASSDLGTYLSTTYQSATYE